MFWLGFDVDRAGAAIDWSDRNAPAPTLTITNPENGHAHLLYALETSIRTAPDGRMKPLKHAAAVENALRKNWMLIQGILACSARIRTTVTGKLPFGSQNSTRWTGLLISSI